MLHNTRMHAGTISFSLYHDRVRVCLFMRVHVYVCSRNDFGALHHIFFFSSLSRMWRRRYPWCMWFLCDDVAIHCSFVRSWCINIAAARSLLYQCILCVYCILCPRCMSISCIAYSSCWVRVIEQSVSDTVNYYKETERTSHFVCVLSPKERLIYFFILKTKSIICFYVVFFSFLIV